MDGKRTKKENIWSQEGKKNTEGKYLAKENCYNINETEGWTEGRESKAQEKVLRDLIKKVEGVEGKE